MTIATPIHPLFLCIPFFLAAQSTMFMQLEDLRVSQEYPDAGILAINENVKKTVHLICDEKQSGDDHFYLFNKEKCIQWLQSRVHITEEGGNRVALFHVVLKKEWKSEDTECHLEAIRMIGRYINDALFTELCASLKFALLDVAKE